MNEGAWCVGPHGYNIKEDEGVTIIGFTYKVIIISAAFNVQ